MDLARCMVVNMLAGALCWTAGQSIVFAQEPPPPPPDARGGPGGRGNPPPPPEQRIQEQLRTLLEMGDAEWAVLQPKIDHIQTLIRERDRFTRPKPPPPPRPDRGAGPDPGRDNDPNLIVNFKSDPRHDPAPGSVNAELARSYLYLARLASSGVDRADAAAALAQYRAARARSDTELAQARSDLRDLVTPRQEIILVVVGILE